jgi:large subunit ribosomal protein L21
MSPQARSRDYKKVLQNPAASGGRRSGTGEVYYMYAIIKTGGKQYRVSVGDKLKVETLAVEAGAQVTLTEVLAVSGEEGLKVGNPTIEGATVTATVLSHGRGEKVRIFKFRRRKHSMKSAGHRQNYTELKIEAIAA